ncbi:hypothetical protein I4U23_018363 [Adineta vaga]|nr:hypothetical protein I4U23_018363 [Adineta vaga]
MASTIMKQACTKCDKCGGIAMCNGCHQSFCIKHFTEHRQELSFQIDNIGQEHDLLRRDMNCNKSIQLLLERINHWEQKSIKTIEENARKARIDLQQLFEQNKTETKRSMDRLTEELRTCHEADDFTEIDLNKWKEQIKELRQMVENISIINIDYDQNMRSAISLIRVNIPQQQQVLSFVPRTRQKEYNNRISNKLPTFDNEQFIDIHGNINLSLNGLTASCSDCRWDGSYSSGVGRYSTGKHHIRFHIEKKNSVYLFFGILTASEVLVSRSTESKSTYGWWELDFIVSNGKAGTRGQNKVINTGDDVTLILDCHNQRIQFQHHRTNMLVDLPVNLELCPFPWKIIVRLDSEGDSVTIVP